MNICFIIPSMRGGGAEKVISILCNELIKSGHNASIMMTSDYIIDYPLNEKINLIHISERTNHNVFAQAKRIFNIRKYYKQHKDTIYVGMETRTNIYALIAGIGLNIKITVSERIGPDKCRIPFIRNTVYSLLGKSFVFQTNDAKEYFGSKIQRRSVIIPNPIDPSLPELDSFVYDSASSENAIIAIGRLDSQKDYPTLLRAFAKICKERADYRLEIYGTGNLKDSLIALSKELEIENHVLFMGFNANVWDLARYARLYVLSSEYEGMPNALIEAMAYGLPVISTDCPIGGPRELITNGQNGILVQVRDVDELYKAIKTLVSDSKLCNTYGENARKIRSILSSEEICRKWVSAITSY